MLCVDFDSHDAMDCGTGGDRSFSLIFPQLPLSAGGGVHMAKHGNRSISSKSGSADVLKLWAST